MANHVSGKRCCVLVGLLMCAAAAWGQSETQLPKAAEGRSHTRGAKHARKVYTNEDFPTVQRADHAAVPQLRNVQGQDEFAQHQLPAPAGSSSRSNDNAKPQTQKSKEQLLWVNSQLMRNASDDEKTLTKDITDLEQQIANESNPQKRKILEDMLQTDKTNLETIGKTKQGLTIERQSLQASSQGASKQEANQ
jgi:hypothetical protein